MGFSTQTWNIDVWNNSSLTRFEVFTAVKNQADVFWVVTPCSVATPLDLEDEDDKVLWNIGILPQHYMASQFETLDVSRSYLPCFRYLSGAVLQ
jgi:hypothetical protein